MKKEAFNHPKVDDLADELGCEYLTAIGIAASLWSIPPRVQSCLSGFLPWKPARIARFIRWEHDADTLIHALLKVRLLDKADPASRAMVEYAPTDPLGDAFGIHDWNQHAPGWVRRECKSLWPLMVASVQESITPSTQNGLPNPSVKEKVVEKGSSGLGVQGEGVFDPPPEWWERVHRWPDHATLTQRGLEAQIRVCRKTLNPEGLETALEARLLRSLVLGWAETGQEPRKRLEAILRGLDNPDVRSRHGLLVNRVSKILETEAA